MLPDLVKAVTGPLPKVDLESIEAFMLSQPEKADIPVHHHFGPGVYIRQITIPKGALCIGHEQRFDHTNILLSGAVAMYDEGGVRIFQAPMIFTGKPGRKLGAAIEDCVWLNIFATDETDVNVLEEMIAKKSETFKALSKSLEARASVLEIES
jgi:hypothetical protein